MTARLSAANSDCRRVGALKPFVFSVKGSRHDTTAGHARRFVSVPKAIAGIGGEQTQRRAEGKPYAQLEHKSICTSFDSIRLNAERGPLAGAEGAKPFAPLEAKAKLSGGPLCRSSRRSGDLGTAQAALGPWQAFIGPARRAAATFRFFNVQKWTVPSTACEARA